MNLLFDILFGKQPPARVREGWDDLHDEGGVMGTLFIGKQGSGKSSSLARSLVEYKLRHPDEAVFLLDWSGDDTDKTLGIISQLPNNDRVELLAERVYDELANPDMVIIHICGNIDAKSIKDRGLKLHPQDIAPFGSMSVTAGYLCPKAVISLNVAGLKAAQDALRK